MGASLAGHLLREPQHTVGRAQKTTPPSILQTAQGRVLNLQHTAGNRAVTGMLHAAGQLSAPGVAQRPGGESLDADTRMFMEARLGHGFSGVRVHRDRAAVESARYVNATAFTVGHDVVLGPGAPSPETKDGQRLLAHELAHVVQQDAGAGAVGRPAETTDSEREADAAAAAVTRGEGFAVQARMGVTAALQGPGSPPSPLALPAEGVDMPWVGKGGAPSSELGYLRDPQYFWSRFQASYSGRLSPANLARIAAGQSPVVDPTWVSFYPQHAAYLGEPLEHHHVGQGARAVPLPETLHDAYTVFHPQRRVVGTPTGGTRPLPPQPTRQQTEAEIRRHVTAGRIRGPGITQGTPPPAPAVPVSSEVAAVQGTPSPVRATGAASTSATQKAPGAPPETPPQKAPTKSSGFDLPDPKFEPKTATSAEPHMPLTKSVQPTATTEVPQPAVRTQRQVLTSPEPTPRLKSPRLGRTLGGLGTVATDVIVGLVVELISAKIKASLDQRRFEEGIRALQPQIDGEKQRAFRAFALAKSTSEPLYFNIRIRVRSLTVTWVAGRGSGSMTTPPSPELESVTISSNNINASGDVEEKALPIEGGHPVIRVEHSQVLTYSEGLELEP